MKNLLRLAMMITAFSLLCSGCSAQSLTLVHNGTSDYRIVIAADAGKNDKAAAALLQRLLLKATGCTLPIVSENSYKGNKGIYVGATARAGSLNSYGQLKDDGYLIACSGGDLILAGRSGHASEYGVYHFAETYMGCRKYDAQPAFIPSLKNLSIPGNLSVLGNPSFVYRQSYYPMSNDAEYLAWHGLHRFEDLWGLWGHSFFKLVPPAQYFATHPEYFSLVNGKRQASQLCLSNKEVLTITIRALKDKMQANPGAEYWSVSPNDEGGYCTCDQCKKTDQEEGGPSGSLIRFVNAVAAAFPGRKITTLAYGYTAAAPMHTKPAANVVILLSTIDAFREQPLKEAASAAAFRRNLEAWKAITSRLFVWDYATQFTNYLNPFPVQDHFGPDFSYFHNEGISGVFEQGSGDTYSDMAELNSYLQAKLLWNTQLDAETIQKEFLDGYYGKAAPFIREYLQQRNAQLARSGRHLDIYGNPITDLRGFLAPEQIDVYDRLLERAAAAVPEPVYAERVNRVRLSLDYAVLQQARHFGPEPHGFLGQAEGKEYIVKPEWKARVSRFVSAASEAGVTELAEGGLSPEQYRQEWESIFAAHYPRNLFANAAVKLDFPFVEDYPAKGAHTLADGMTGFTDFSYNWLCFYGSDMSATLSLEQPVSFSRIQLRFLDDPRHWIFLPASITLSCSQDGIHYTDAGTQQTGNQEEHTNSSIRQYAFSVPAKARFIKVSAKNLPSLPSWRNTPGKKPMIACDEIMVLP